jgi:putative ABC transport system permease protein
MLVLLCFAAMALALGVVGVYGVMSYSVAQRSHEIGVRMALGSDQGRVLRLVLNQTVILAVIGVAIGVAAALAFTRFMSSLLYSVRPSDPYTMVAVSILLMIVSALAGYIPARRASRVDPMIVLRHE